VQRERAVKRIPTRKGKGARGGDQRHRGIRAIHSAHNVMDAWFKTSTVPVLTLTVLLVVARNADGPGAYPTYSLTVLSHVEIG
jgi:hypothetical protein